MATPEDSELVLRLDVEAGAGETGRVVIKPLGVAVAGPGFDIHVPGVGRVDLHQRPYPGEAVDLGHVEIAGERAQYALDRIADQASDLPARLSAGTAAILVMPVQHEVAMAMGGASPRDAEIIDHIGHVIVAAIDSGPSGLLRTAYCRIHPTMPEICPLPH